MGKYLDEFKTKQEAKKLLETQKNAQPISDNEYWAQYTPKKENLEDDIYGGVNEYASLHYHDISIDVAIKFKDIDGVIFESKDKDVNCNILDLNKFFARLKKQIRLLDESKCSKKGGFD